VSSRKSQFPKVAITAFQEDDLSRYWSQQGAQVKSHWPWFANIPLDSICEKLAMATGRGKSNHREKGHHMLRTLILALIVTATSSFTYAQCTARHLGTGQIVPVIETGGFTSSFRAIATHLPDGQPIIYYGPEFASLSPLMKAFVSLHECAHLVENTTNEFLANCRALQLMRQRGLTQQEEQYIAQSHVNDGALPAQYGGSGAMFWRQTLACAGPR
jgi:hypothetical protein